jgi:polyisoprenoid-binding protein YceI
MLTRIIRLALIAAAVPALVSAGESYEIDRSHSHVGFSVRHFGISNVRGGFGTFTGKLEIDEQNLENSSVVIRIETASISTDDDRRDEHLRSSDFLNAPEHPEIVFESTGIESKGNGEFMVRGNLAIRGVTKEIVMPVTFAGPLKDPFGSMRIGVEGGLSINRQDYGVSWSRLMDNGGLVVSDDVKISFSLEAKRPIEAPEPDSDEG